jgi:hypothetical protein
VVEDFLVLDVIVFAHLGKAQSRVICTTVIVDDIHYLVLFRWIRNGFGHQSKAEFCLSGTKGATDKRDFWRVTECLERNSGVGVALYSNDGVSGLLLAVPYGRRIV